MRTRNRQRKQDSERNERTRKAVATFVEKRKGHIKYTISIDKASEKNKASKNKQKRRNGYLQDIARRPLLQLLAGSSGVTCLRTREPGESERLIGSHSARSLTPASATPAAVYGDSSSGERRERDLIFRPEPAGRRPFFLFLFFPTFLPRFITFFLVFVLSTDRWSVLRPSSICVIRVVSFRAE